MPFNTITNHSSARNKFNVLKTKIKAWHFFARNFRTCPHATFRDFESARKYIVFIRRAAAGCASPVRWLTRGISSPPVVLSPSTQSWSLTTVTVFFSLSKSLNSYDYKVRWRYHCLRFQILHTIYSQFSSLPSCYYKERPHPDWSFKIGLDYLD